MWNKLDAAPDPAAVLDAALSAGAVCVSAKEGEGLEELAEAVQVRNKRV